MKATLTFEVHDDFKKGDCINCRLSDVYTTGDDDYLVCDVCSTPDKCPLEIRENLPLVIIKDNKCVDTTSGHLYSVDYNICKYCSKGCKNVGYIGCGEFEPKGE